MADYFETITLHWIKLPHYPVSKISETWVGEANSLSWQMRDIRLYVQRIILVTQGQVTVNCEWRQYPDIRVVANLDWVFCNIKYIHVMMIIVPYKTHSVDLGMLTHLIDSVPLSIKQNSMIDWFNQL